LFKIQDKDPNLKVYFLAGFKNLLSYMGKEFVGKIPEIFQITLKFISEQDEAIVSKAKECDELVKAKFVEYTETETFKICDLFSAILKFIHDNFGIENLNVKNWSLGWLSFLINLDPNLHRMYAEIIINLINFISQTTHPEILTTVQNILEYAQNKFRISTWFNDLHFNIEFLNKLLEDFVSIILTDPKYSPVQLETLLIWSIFIANKLIELVQVDQNQATWREKAKPQDFDTIQEILLSAMKIITNYSKQPKPRIRQLIIELNNLLVSNFAVFDVLLGDGSKISAEKYDHLLEFSFREMSDTDAETIEFILRWNDEIFNVIHERYLNHLENLIKILDNQNEQIHNNVIRFISNIIQKLNNSTLTEKIILYFLQNKNSESNISGFLKFIKILFDRVKSMDLFLAVVKEINKLQKKDFFSKIVQSFHIFVIFEENFRFVRDLLKDVRNRSATPQQILTFREIFRLWCYDPISLFGLCLMAGIYQIAFEVIYDHCSDDLHERELIQLTNVVKMIELPYFSQIRMDLLDLQK